MPQPSRIDFSWRRPDALALLALCVLAGLALALSWGPDCLRLGPDIGVDAVKVALANDKVDPNTASAASIRRLPGVGPRITQEIIDHRNASPASRPFQRPQDLAKVRGIGPLTVETLRPYLQLDDPGQDQQPPRQSQ